MIRLLIAISMVALLIQTGCIPNQINESGKPESTQSGITKRVFAPAIHGQWAGNGISYSAYRDGEGPSQQSLTSKSHILEDLKLIEKRWHLIRMYDASQQSRNILEVIRDNKLPILVMQGAWISGQQTDEENQNQVNKLIKLANDFPDIIVAVNVGNEIFVDWSAHKVKEMEPVIGYIRQVRASVRQPVTVNDDYNFWNKPYAAKIVAEVDFIGMHAYAFWNNKTLDEAIAWTQRTYGDIQSRYPKHLVTYSETGWPTSRIQNDGSYEGDLIGKAGEAEQKSFFEQYNAWVKQNHIISFYFEAFDENWKGGIDGKNPMTKAEKHWGLYNADRSPKQALK